MSRRAGSHRQSPPTERISPARRVWSEVIVPAIVIGLVGIIAVAHVYGCARISIIECDLRRLERACEAQEAAQIELKHQLAKLRNAERIQEHIARRQLDSPRGTHHVLLSDLPPGLYETLPAAETDTDRREIRLGQLAAVQDDSLSASGRDSARVQ
jgi:cell division protein FtsL